MTERSESPISALYKPSTVITQLHRLPPRTVAVLAEFARQLQVAKYCEAVARAHLMGALHVAIWAHENRVSLRRLSADDAKAFIDHAVRCRCVKAGGKARWPTSRRHKVLQRLRIFRAFLETGVVGGAWPGDPVKLPPIVRGFETWLVAHRGLSATTVSEYVRHASIVASSVGTRPADYTPLTIHRFVRRSWRTGTPSSIPIVARVLRHFIRFLVARGLCRVDLEGAVPRMRTVRPAPPPFVLTKKDFERTLQAVKGNPRDRAILLLLFRLGLRTSDVARLRADDIHWRDGTILVSGKNKREELLPLPQDVGDAVLAYLRSSRPRVDSVYMFLRTRAPHAPIGRTGVAVMRRTAMQRARIKLPTTRAHLTRHSVATDVLRTSVPLHALQRLLRHRRVSTTGSYCHVGQALLRSVCRRWPV